ncbi:hypothetical protein [Pseudomonas fluorescens]|uniref:hypothetical protein n=1 Tax=Pseudomonas fluorescens TaxID=294 RepID=UPI001CB8A790|nr:hypothetical protein [Pseudomonas fluorescens]
MIGEAIQSDTPKALVSQHAIREAVVGRIAGDDGKWTLSIRLGGPTARLVAVCSRSEPLRTWASLTAVGRFADAVGVARLYSRAVTGESLSAN